MSPTKLVSLTIGIYFYGNWYKIPYLVVKVGKKILNVDAKICRILFFKKKHMEKMNLSKFRHMLITFVYFNLLFKRK